MLREPAEEESEFFCGTVVGRGRWSVRVRASFSPPRTAGRPALSMNLNDLLCDTLPYLPIFLLT